MTKVSIPVRKELTEALEDYKVKAKLDDYHQGQLDKAITQVLIGARDCELDAVLQHFAGVYCSAGASGVIRGFTFDEKVAVTEAAVILFIEMAASVKDIMKDNCGCNVTV